MVYLRKFFEFVEHGLEFLFFLAFVRQEAVADRVEACFLEQSEPAQMLQVLHKQMQSKLAYIKRRYEQNMAHFLFCNLIDINIDAVHANVMSLFFFLS